MMQDHGHATAAADEPTGFGAAMVSAMSLMHAAMTAAPISGDPDRDFLAMMIPHHHGAVEMARLVLLHGRDPLVRELASSIVAGQQAEIAGMRGRLIALAETVDTAGGEFPALGGTRGVADASIR